MYIKNSACEISLDDNNYAIKQKQTRHEHTYLFKLRQFILVSRFFKIILRLNLIRFQCVFYGKYLSLKSEFFSYVIGIIPHFV